MKKENYYLDKKWIINSMSKEERQALKESLLGKTIKIHIDPSYGLITEHGFPVATATYNEFRQKSHNDFEAKIIATEPMVTIYEIQ